MRPVFRLLMVPALFAAALLAGNGLRAAGEEVAVERDYSRVVAPPAPAGQTLAEVAAKSDGCYSCHVRTLSLIHISEPRDPKTSRMPSSA